MPTPPHKPPFAEAPPEVRQAAKFWGGKYGKKISNETARQIVQNVVKVVSLLDEWDRQS